MSISHICIMGMLHYFESECNRVAGVRTRYEAEREYLFYSIFFLLFLISFDLRSSSDE